VLPGMLRNGFTPAVATCGGQLYVNPADGKLYRLNKQRDGWDEVGSVQKPRTVHRLVALGDNRLIVLGGASRAGNVAETEIVEPACCPTPTKAAAIDLSKQCYCTVMTSTLVDGESREVEYQGVKIKLCCAACLRKWNADPEAYLNAELLPQLKGKTLPTRSIAQVYCPVYRDRVVSAKDPSVEYQGRTIYFFNETAKQRFLSDPEQYAKPEWLPQLKAAR
jgi:YHS domain-containing protein